MTDNINVNIKGDSSDFQKAAGKAEKSGKGLSKQMALTAAAGVAAFATIGAVITTKLLGAYAKQEQAEKGIRQTLTATGYAAGLTADELFRMASELQKVSTFGDEAILGGQKLLLTFKNIGEETFPRATKAMLDMAQSMDMDLKGASIQLGKALNDPRTGLSMLTRVGITFTDQQKEMIKTMQASGDIAGAQAVILAELESQFGGAAAAAAEGTGSFTQFSNIVGDIAEKLGGKLLPVAISVVSELSKFAEEIDMLFADKTAAENIASLTAEIDKQKKIVEKYSAIKFDLFGTNKSAIDEANATIKTNQDKLDKILDAEQKAEDKKILIKANAAAKTQDAKTEQLAQTIEFNEALSTLDDENAAMSLEKLQAQLLAQKEAKQLAKIEELEANGKHEEALALIVSTGITQKLAIAQKARKKEISDQAAFFSAASSLATSESKALAAIGKAAAITNIAIKTPDAIASSFAFGARIGGPPLGFALGAIAATAMATQAANIAGISGFEEGGFIGGTGGGATGGGDNTLFKGRKGELVLTAQDQGQLLEAIRGGSLGGGNNQLEVVLTMNDNLMDFIDAQVIERRATGTGGI